MIRFLSSFLFHSIIQIWNLRCEFIKKVYYINIILKLILFLEYMYSNYFEEKQVAWNEKKMKRELQHRNDSKKLVSNITYFCMIKFAFAKNTNGLKRSFMFNHVTADKFPFSGRTISCEILFVYEFPETAIVVLS